MLDVSKLVFLDESGVTTKMARRCGRSAKGKPLVCAVPHGHWKTNTFIAGLRADGIVAPWLLDGAMNGETFCLWLERELAPVLNQGDIVIMDNLATHKVARVKSIIEKAGASLMYLPPYSPDFNPIEMVFAKLKADLRKAAKRTIEDLCQRISQTLQTYSKEECMAYIRHDGYAST